MTDTVVITFPYARIDAERIASALGAELVEYSDDVFSSAFISKKRIIALMATGIVVRKIASLIRDKWMDPAVVVISPDLRYAIPLLGGHHGANELAQELTSLGITPVITTATESRGRPSVEITARVTGTDILNRDSTRRVNTALLDRDVPVHVIEGPSMIIAGPEVSVLIRQGTYSVGVGCRKGISPNEVSAALHEAFTRLGISPQEILVYATTIKKTGETGLIEGINHLSGTLIFLDDDTINAQQGTSPSRAGKIGLLGVAEPCALATSKTRILVMPKKVFGRVTVAIAR